MDSVTYEVALPVIMRGVVDLAAARQILTAERGRRKWTQAQLAKRAGVAQGQISRLEDLSQPLSDLAARVLFRIIENGFGWKVGQFLTDLEHGNGGTDRAMDEPLTTEGKTDVAASILSSGIADPAVARALGQTLIDAGSRLIAAETRSGAPTTDRTVPKARRKQSTRRHRRA